MKYILTGCFCTVIISFIILVFLNISFLNDDLLFSSVRSEYFFISSLVLFLFSTVSLFFIQRSKYKNTLLEAKRNQEAHKYLSSTLYGSVILFDRENSTEYVSPYVSYTLGRKHENISSFLDLIKSFSKNDQNELEEKYLNLKNKNIGFDHIILFQNQHLRFIGSHQSKFDVITIQNFSNEKRLHEEIDRLNLRRSILRELLDTLPVPIWYRDEKLNLLDCNKNFLKAVEASTPKQAIREEKELVDISIDHKGKRLAEKAKETNAPQTDNYHVVIDGKRRFLEITEMPIQYVNDTQSFNFIGGYALDKSEVEAVEKNLKRHLRAHSEVLESLTSAIAIFGSDQRLEFYNSSYSKLWGLDEPYLQEKPSYGEILETLRERRRLPEYANFLEFKKSEILRFTTLIDTYEEVIHLPDETTVRCLMTPHPFGGVLFTYDDVTHTLALERSYNTLVAVERETLNNLHEGVAVFGSDGRLKLCNPTFKTMWALKDKLLDKEPHLSKVFEELQKKLKKDQDLDEFRSQLVMAIGERSSQEGRIECNDGSIFDYSTTPLPDGNALFSFVDMTDSIRVERALLERNEALMTADRLKTEFLANISYELRTPLNSTLGFAEVLKEQYFGQLNERQDEYVNAIITSSQRLIVLINDILDLALVEAGHLALEKKSIDIKNMLESVINLSRESARHHNLKLELDCKKTIGFLNGDERRLKQVLFNVISNAIKFTPSGGIVTVKAERKKGMINLIVKDTGVGIKEEDQERIFNKFERGDPMQRNAGVGLGLSLVKSVVELHGGEIDIQSKPNEGTVVNCVLPTAA